MTEHFRQVGETSPTEDRTADDASGTLGALLYADSAKARIAEEDWIALVSAMAQGDQAALRAFYERTNRVVFTLIMRITNDRQAAEELTVDVFHDAWRRAAKYDVNGGTVLGWVMNQARSRAIDRVRYEQRKKRVDPHGSLDPDAAPMQDSGQALDMQEQGRALHAALAVLSQDERDAIETAFFSDLTHVEVAQRLQQPLGTVKTRIRSGLGKLRHALTTEEGA